MKRFSVLKIEMGSITIKAIMHGFWRGEAQPNSPMHNHAAFEFHTVMRGSVILKTNNKTYLLEEKDSVLIPPETFHSFINKEKGSAIISFTFFVEKNKRKTDVDYKSLLEENLSEADSLIIFRKNLQIEECLTGIISNIYSESCVAKERTQAYFILLFSEMFSLFDEQGSSTYNYDSNASENDTRIFMIEEYFNEFYMEDISLKKLSKSLYLSEKQTDKIIKKAFGEGFREHLCKIRLLIAQKLLTDTKKEIKEIACEVGYQSYNGFYLAFKDKIEMTPQQYRDLHTDQK